MTGPGLIDLDASVSRSFPIVKERLNLDTRADFFNFLNHPNFDPPVRTFDSQNFGSIPSANTFGNRPPARSRSHVNLVF